MKWAKDGPRKIGSQEKRRQHDNPTIPLGEIKEGRNDEGREGEFKSEMYTLNKLGRVLSIVVQRSRL